MTTHRDSNVARDRDPVAYHGLVAQSLEHGARLLRGIDGAAEHEALRDRLGGPRHVTARGPRARALLQQWLPTQ